MSYRKEWRHCKKFFPRVYCYGMGDGFRIVPDKDDREKYREFYCLGQGNTRKEAWQKAAEYVGHFQPTQLSAPEEETK